VAHVEAVPRRRRRWRLDGRWFLHLLVVAEWGGVLERRRWHQRSPGTEADGEGDDDEGVPTVEVCKGNKILPSDFGPKGGSSIYRLKYQQRFYVEPLLIIHYQ
jgi:hypothetical protein